MWICIPKQAREISSPCAQGEEDSSWDLDSRCLALEQSVMLNGKHMPARYCKQGCRTAHWMKLLSGMISRPSMASLGMERWISSLRAGRANRFPTWGREKESPTTATCGPASPGSCPSAGQTSSSGKTSPPTLTLAFRECVPNFGKWAIHAKRDCLLRLKWVSRINGKDFSFWPTPRANMPTIGNTNRYFENRLEDVLAGWMLRRRKQWKTREKLHIRRAEKSSKTGDGSSSIILRINPLFLHWLMNWPLGWANPSQRIGKNKLERWATVSSRLVRRMLSAYSSDGPSGPFNSPPRP